MCVEKVTEISSQKRLFLGVCKNKYPFLHFWAKIWETKIQCLCGFPDFLIFIITHPQKWSKKYTMFQGNLLEPKKGKTVGSAADMTIEYLIDILTYIFV